MNIGSYSFEEFKEIIVFPFHGVQRLPVSPGASSLGHVSSGRGAKTGP
jgi:hypothetical protein